MEYIHKKLYDYCIVQGHKIQGKTITESYIDSTLIPWIYFISKKTHPDIRDRDVFTNYFKAVLSIESDKVASVNIPKHPPKDELIYVREHKKQIAATVNLDSIPDEYIRHIASILGPSANHDIVSYYMRWIVYASRKQYPDIAPIDAIQRYITLYS